MRSVLALFALTFTTAISIESIAQTRASEGKIDYQGRKSCAQIELSQNSDIVADAIKDQMAAHGIKSGSSKGFDLYKGEKVNPDRKDQGDFYFKIERKSRREKDATIVYLIIARPGENVALRSENDDLYLQEAKSYLNDIVPAVDAYKLEVDIKDQNETLTSANKKLQNLVKDSVDLDAKIKGLQQKLEENKVARQTQSDEVVKQQGVLEAMKGRRKRKD